MSAPISMDKQYRTRDGRKVRVLCVDRVAGSGLPVLALVSDTKGNEHPETFTADGRYIYGQNGPTDLIEVKPRRVEFFNRYSGEWGCAYLTRAEADRRASAGRTECIRVEYEEGQFDDEVQS